jgi:HK97 gp10 family phage protein
MATFNAKITGVDALIRKINNAPQKVAEESTKIINDSVKEIYNAAKARVPVAKKNGGTLKNSIGFTEYTQGVGASVFADTKYAAYVEFGTGDFGFGIPVYPNINMNDLEGYALLFKKSKPKPFIGMPYRPYMFNSYSEVLGKMVNKIKKIRI